MNDETSEISKRRLGKLRDQEAYYGIACPPEIRMEIEDIEKQLQERLNSASSILSDSTNGGNKAVIKNIVIMSAVTGVVITVYLIWSHGRPLTVDLMVANVSFGTAVVFFLALIIELTTSRFQKS
jgi:hypothetical protein